MGCSGHHGIDVSFGASNLITRFDFQTRFVHDISVEWFTLGTVFADGKGVDLNLDMHRCRGLRLTRLVLVLKLWLSPTFEKRKNNANGFSRPEHQLGAQLWEIRRVYDGVYQILKKKQLTLAPPGT